MTDESALNSNPFNLRVIEEFRAHSGKVADFGDIPLLLLTTVGRRSGLPRTTPLVHLADGDRLIVFAANGGASNAPGWFHNLMAAGEGLVEVGDERRPVRPVLVDEAEHEELWARQTAQDPNFANFRGRTSRTIPVVALVRHRDGQRARRGGWPVGI
ncbi:nitroreductase/quinone reductase family protein [Streptomyces sp. NPDC050418]|uniref:nitroreductase/quinone reductase family protein n=1 Tax=Streptomyces sp. NPDC050418 TaxID=3365612 RepID=UPI00379016A7